MPLVRRSVGDLLGEELRRLDADEPYADTLAAFAHPDGAARPASTVTVRGEAARGGAPAEVALPVPHSPLDAGSDPA